MIPLIALKKTYRIPNELYLGNDIITLKFFFSQVIHISLTELFLQSTITTLLFILSTQVGHMNQKIIMRVDHMDYPSTLIPIEQYVCINAFNILNFSYHLYPSFLWVSLHSFTCPKLIISPRWRVHSYAYVTHDLTIIGGFSHILFYVSCIYLRRNFLFSHLIFYSIVTR